MKTVRFLSQVALLLILVAGVTSCGPVKKDNTPEDEPVESEVVSKSGAITANETWKAGNEYQLDGKVYVANGATLTIEAGTKIIGLKKDKKEDTSALIVTAGSKIMAVGTADKPIVFTSEHGKDSRWGGLVILGNAPINQEDRQEIEGIDPTSTDIPKGVDITYGGNNANDNSGQLSFVRVEYAGAAIADANELNSFTFGGVGKGTKLDHLQAYYGADDSFEFFGGNVNASYLVSTATNDDAFDFDFGYTGTITYALSTIDPKIGYSKDPNGIECDNDAIPNEITGDKGSNKTPFTRPVLKYVTIVGTKDGQVAAIENSTKKTLKSGANFRRNCQFDLQNSIIHGFPKGILKETENEFVMKNNFVVSAPAGNEFATFSPDPSNQTKSVLADPYSGKAAGLKATVPNTGAFANSDWLTGEWVIGY
ncbi:MAG: hypothetical protein Q4D93_06785 [Porphyromonas sp.]|nr:hypothetical protein [Porphyromonas sp.]